MLKIIGKNHSMLNEYYLIYFYQRILEKIQIVATPKE